MIARDSTDATITTVSVSIAVFSASARLLPSRTMINPASSSTIAAQSALQHGEVFRLDADAKQQFAARRKTRPCPVIALGDLLRVSERVAGDQRARW